MQRSSRLDAKLHIKGHVLDIDRFTSHDGPGVRTKVFIETSGFGAREAVQCIASVSDLIFYDIKTMNAEELTGISNEVMRKLNCSNTTNLQAQNMSGSIEII